MSYTTELDKIVQITDGSVWSAPKGTPSQSVITVEDVSRVFDFDLVQVETQTVPFVHTNNDLIDRLDVPKKLAIARVGGTLQDGSPSPATVLSTMGKSYNINHYNQYFPDLAEILIGLGCRIVFAGTLGGGERAYMSVSLPGDGSELCLPGAEKGRTLIHIGESVNGSTSSRCSLNFERLRCMNAINSSLMGLNAVWAIPHTSGATKRLAEAEAMLTNAISEANLIHHTIERLANADFFEADFAKLVKSVMKDRPGPAEEENRKRAAWDSKFDGIMSRYHADDIDGVRDTKWGAFNALQGYSQHVRGTRGGDRFSRSVNETVFGGEDPFLAKAAKELILA